MVLPPLQWSLPNSDNPPEDWVRAVQTLSPDAAVGDCRHATQILWQRHLRDLPELAGFLDPRRYQPTPPEAFGDEMQRAVQRLLQALEHQEAVAIWGDFDADGVTATAVLWEGLSQVFAADRLRYYIPNRFRESHGLSRQGLDYLADWSCNLIVTCDTGSTHRAEIEYAQSLNIDVIITDHHTLPEERPPVVAMINPRLLPAVHPLATLSGVAVAYKLLEALYAALPTPPHRPLESLLDLVAIGLIADLVELRGDCRYLAQRGLEQLQRHTQPNAAFPRPGIAELLRLCKRSGDRPSDISFGIGPRINAVSRIHGDASFCVEMLTSHDPDRCRTLALEAELANTRRKGLQKDVLQQVNAQLAQLDLATTQVIVLANDQWPHGVLGLVAGQVAQQYGKPTLLLAIDPPPEPPDQPRLARGSARSVQGIDLYALFNTQAHLLHGYGGHPLAAGLSLPAENIPLLAAALNRQVRERQDAATLALGPRLTVDLVVTVAELGKSLFRELKLLEPYGMGNPTPRLLIRNGWFERPRVHRIRDQRGRLVGSVKALFELWDDTAQVGFPGDWWDHYPDDLPQGRCDAVVELDFDAYNRQYQVRLIAVRPVPGEMPLSPVLSSDQIIDVRSISRDRTSSTADADALILDQPPLTWTEWQHWRQQAAVTQRPLAVAFTPPVPSDPRACWTDLVGLMKYLGRTGQRASLPQIAQQLQMTEPTVRVGLKSLIALGFEVDLEDESQIQIKLPAADQVSSQAALTAVQTFWDAIQEEQFRRRYFYQAPLAVLTEGGYLTQPDAHT